MDWDGMRHNMVREQIASRGISNGAVISAMSKVPRHLFVPESLISRAYDDQPLPIGYGQTISQPYIVALMTELLKPDPNDIVLEIGTGSGYQTAILAEIVKKVFTIERVRELAVDAQKRLTELGYNNIEFFIGNGWNGLEKFAPFDGIIVTAAAHKMPTKLLDQLRVGARLVIPIGTFEQTLVVMEKIQDGFRREESIPVRFVPLIEENADENNSGGIKCLSGCFS